MTVQEPGSSPEGESAAPGTPRGPRFAWVPGSVDTGPVPEFGSAPERVLGQPAPPAGLPALDYPALLEALAASGRLADAGSDQGVVLDDELAAASDGRMSEPDLAWAAAVAVEHMAPGPAQAGWLETATLAAGRLDEDALAGMMIAAQRAASHAHAAGLAAAGQISARAAAADSRIGLEADGRPVRLCRDAQGQISFALMLSGYSAAAWADLGITLTWRLPATGQALAAGVVDLERARAIAEATSVLSQDTARVVEAKALPGAGRRTAADLKDWLRRLVIAADPEGAERRRLAAERHADVRLFGEVDQTATIVADKQPQIEAAAGFARLNALARARKAAGLEGPLGWHRSQVLLGLLNGTLPPIPPAEGARPDDPGPGDGGPDQHGPYDGGPGGGPGAGHGRRDDSRPDDLPAPRDEDAPEDDGLDEALDRAADDAGEDGRWWDPDEEDDDLAGTGPGPVWPQLGAIPPALGRPAAVPADGRPVPGLLDVTLPWTTLTGQTSTPGLLGRIGPITATQARHLAAAAEADPAVPWRVIVTSTAGQAIAVSRIRRRSRASPPQESSCHDSPCRDGPCRDGPPGNGLVGRITLTITQDTITTARQTAAGAGPAGTGPPAGADPPEGITAAALRAATAALDRALAQGLADQQAGGCAHTGESPAYRPPPRLREFVIARDVTCRSPACRQPAWRADLDHTHPYDDDGRTCGCNLGGACRGHHQLKQHPRWKLEQTRPGEFRWTTPAGRTYTITPDTHPV